MCSSNINPKKIIMNVYLQPGSGANESLQTGHLHVKPVSSKTQENVIFPSPSQIYNAVFENSFHPAFIEMGDGLILKINEKLSKIFGYSKQELIGKDGLDLFKTNEISFKNFLSERNKNGISKAEITCIRKSGDTFPCRISSVIYNSDKGEQRIMNTLVDISKDVAARWAVTQ
jgi:PAS domain S-box-containing protein